MASHVKNSITQRIATPKQGLSSLGTGKIWRAAAPLTLALAALTGCVTAPQTNPLPQQPTTRMMAAADRLAAYTELNLEIQLDPRTKDTTVVLDPGNYSHDTALIQGAEQSLQTLSGSGSNITYHINRIASMLSKNIWIHQQSIVASMPSITPPKIMTPTAYIVNKHSQYICLAMGQTPDTNYTDMDNNNVSTDKNPSTKHLPAFEKAINNSMSNPIAAALHEAGHCLNRKGITGDYTSSEFAQERNDESTADTFAMLYRLRNGESDMLIKIQTYIIARRADVVRSLYTDGSHNTSGPLLLLLADLQKNPNMAAEIKTLPIADLTSKAQNYSDQYTANHYSHAQIKSFSPYQKEYLSNITDKAEQDGNAFIAGLMHRPAQTELPQTLTISGAYNILQISHAAQNYLVQPKGSALTTGLENLRKKFPDIMEIADTAFANELTKHPWLESSAPTQAENRAAANLSVLSMGSTGTEQTTSTVIQPKTRIATANRHNRLGQ